MGKLYLVRHADAGHRRDHDGPDEQRPLSERGRRQAEGLSNQLHDAGITRLVTSPYVRCIETLAPLGGRLTLPVEDDARLAEGQGATGALDLAATLRHTSAVLCSHGDVIPDTMAALERRGCEFTSPLEWRKGSVWVLHRDGNGEIVTAEAWPPPDV